MNCRHVLGVSTDMEGNIFFEYEDAEHTDYLFGYCPSCGINLVPYVMMNFVQ